MAGMAVIWQQVAVWILFPIGVGCWIAIIVLGARARLRKRNARK
jgi:hypothetical protein